MLLTIKWEERNMEKANCFSKKRIEMTTKVLKEAFWKLCAKLKYQKGKSK